MNVIINHVGLVFQTNLLKDLLKVGFFRKSEDYL